MKAPKRSSYLPFLIIGATIVILVYALTARGSDQPSLSINQVAQDIKNGSISKISEDGDNLTITYKNGTQAQAIKEDSTTLTQQLEEYGVTPDQLTPDKLNLDVKAPSSFSGILNILGYILPFVLMVGLFFLLFR